jgi:hypothetical protein
MEQDRDLYAAIVFVLQPVDENRCGKDAAMTASLLELSSGSIVS